MLGKATLRANQASPWFACLRKSRASGFLVICLVIGVARSGSSGDATDTAGGDDRAARAEILKLQVCLVRADVRFREVREREFREREMSVPAHLTGEDAARVKLALGLIDVGQTMEDRQRWQDLLGSASPEKKTKALQDFNEEMANRRFISERDQNWGVRSNEKAVRLKKELMSAGVSRNRRIEILEDEYLYGKTHVEDVLRVWTARKLADMDMDESQVRMLESEYGKSVIQEVLGDEYGPRCMGCRSWKGIGWGPFVSRRGGRVAIRTEDQKGGHKIVYRAMDELGVFDQVYLKVKLSPRTWTSSKGQYTVQASLVEFRNGLVHLAKDDGAVVKVPVMKLSDDDRKFLNQ